MDFGWSCDTQGHVWDLRNRAQKSVFLSKIRLSCALALRLSVCWDGGTASLLVLPGMVTFPHLTADADARPLVTPRIWVLVEGHIYSPFPDIFPTDTILSTMYTARMHCHNLTVSFALSTSYWTQDHNTFSIKLTNRKDHERGNWFPSNEMERALCPAQLLWAIIITLLSSFFTCGSWACYEYLVTCKTPYMNKFFPMGVSKQCFSLSLEGFNITEVSQIIWYMIYTLNTSYIICILCV